MKLLLTNITVIDAESEFHQKRCDILVQQGIIAEVHLSSKKQHIASIKQVDCSEVFVSPGFADMRASLREPGMEYKEDLQSAAKTAVAGGYTIIACLPDTHPVIQHKASIEFVYSKAEQLPVHILPYGALSKNCAGIDLNELYDMHQSGAVGFTDANTPIQDAGLMLRALQYSTIFGGLIFSHPDEVALSATGKMHESETSTALGLKGIPAMAEDLMVMRDIELAKYANAAIHVSHLSSKGSVELIRKAKKQGVKISCDVSVANLCYTSDDLITFDSTFKVVPPLRSNADKKALWDGIADGTIDCIVSDHQPEDIEHKQVEFDYALPGMIMLQTAFSLAVANAPKSVTLEQLVKAFSSNPRKLLKRPLVIQKGAPAELTLYNPKLSWEYNENNNYSKAKNSPVLGKTLLGKIIAVINKNQFFTNQ
jgi:dihydroorotase